MDAFSEQYQDLIDGSYDCVDRIVLNAYFPAGQYPAGRRLRAFAKAEDIPVIDCRSGDKKFEIANRYLEKHDGKPGVFLILVGRARCQGHITIKMSGHPPFGAQIILNGHEFVARAAEKAGIDFGKEGNCFVPTPDGAGLAKVADTLSEPETEGRLRKLCDRWIYSSCLIFGLNLEEQQRSAFHYGYSSYQLEYSRNLQFLER